MSLAVEMGMLRSRLRDTDDAPLVDEMAAKLQAGDGGFKLPGLGGLPGFNPFKK